MDSAYLKNHVGTVLAKAVAEAVVAQPANPQEYVALFLLHHLQQEEVHTNAATRKRRATMAQEQQTQQHAQLEKVASDAIRRGVHQFSANVKAKRETEEARRSAYEAAEAEAEELLEQEASIKGDAEEDGEDVKGQKLTEAGQLSAAQSALRRSRAEFFVAQRFVLGLRKSDIAELKAAVVAAGERVRIAQDAVVGRYDRAAAQATTEVELTPTSLAGAGVGASSNTPNFSAEAAALTARMAEVEMHDHISVPYVNFTVLRCLCYLLLNATPTATNSAAKVASLMKPSTMCAQIRAFNPVAGYDRHIPLRLEKLVPELAAEHAGEDEDHAEDADGGQSVPMPQATTRQARRVARILRTCWLDGGYECEVNPEEYYTEEMIEEDSGREPNPATPHISTIAQEIEAAAQARQRADTVRSFVTTQVKERGGTLLHGLLRFITAAATYRQARDELVRMQQDRGLAMDPTEELPEEEEEDPLNDEALVDAETGEMDYAATQALQARIGIDMAEALGKVWEARDARQREMLTMKAAALQRQMDGGGAEGDEDE